MSYNKYIMFDPDLKKGDILIFENGEKKTIKRIEDDHRLIFENDETCDLWTNKEKIVDVIRTKVEEPKLRIFEFISEPKSSEISHTSLASSYKELNKMLYHGGNLVEFYHITAIQNALEIVSGDYFYSRESGKGHIRYDNVEKNEITSSVMSSNYSSRLEKYARFYLNIKNKATYAFYKNYMQCGSFGVILAIGFPTIWKSKTQVILSPINAHNLVDSDFNWSKYNIGVERNLKNLDASKFNLKRTFTKCDFAEENPYLAAEILFYDKIDLDNISHIYFRTAGEMNYFLSKLTYNKRVTLQSKCVVRGELFW